MLLLNERTKLPSAANASLMLTTLFRKLCRRINPCKQYDFSDEVKKVR